MIQWIKRLLCRWSNHKIFLFEDPIHDISDKPICKVCGERLDGGGI